MDDQPQAKNPFDDLGNHPKPETNFTGRPPLTSEEKNLIIELGLQKLGVNEIARRVKRSPATVSRVLKSLKVAGAITFGKGDKVLAKELIPAKSLREIHEVAQQIITILTEWNKEAIGKYGFLILKACEAIRKDIELHLKICEALYNAEAIARWQEELLNILGEIDPDARERFYRKYNERGPV
jgi:DNA-binding MarR family transcriptional regulator